MRLASSLALCASAFAPAVASAAQLGQRERAFSPREFDTVAIPRSLDCADFDSDGELDVLWCSNFPYIYVSHGLGGGEVGPPVSKYAWPNVPPPPQYPPNVLTAIAVDFDVDGLMDVVCAYEASGSLGWLRGNGAGGFATPQVFSAGLWVTDVELAAADLNGDLYPDLVVTGGPADRAVWIPGTGGGAVAAPVTLWIGQQPDGACIGDLDGDGDLDVALALATGNAITVLHNDGLGGFTAGPLLASGQRPVAVACGDFDADGIQDLASADLLDGTVSVHFATPGGGYLPRVTQTVGGNPRAVVARDVDQDGFVDLVTGTGTNNNAGAARLLRSLGSQSFGAPESVMPSSPSRDVRVFDFDSNGALDLLSIDKSASLVSIAFAGAPGQFAAATLTPCAAIPRGLALADFDENGRLDVLESEDFGNTRQVRVLLGDGQGGLTAAPAQALVAEPAATIAGDFDGDGHADALIVERAAGDVRLAFGDGAGNLAPLQLVGTSGAWVMRAGTTDLDADGALDLLIALPGPPRIAILAGLGGGSFAPPVFVSTPTDTKDLDFADVDEDGAVDVLANSWPHPQLAFGDGQGGLGPWQSVTATYGVDGLALADLNADGHVDLCMSSGSSTRWALGAGNGTFGVESSVLHHLPSNPSEIQAADMDCDGHVDLVVGTSRVGVLHGDGLGAFGSLLFYGLGRNGDCVFGELNGDGRIDAVSVDWFGFSVSVQLNRGPSCPPSTYCVAKQNSLGCLPAIGSSGTPSSSATTGFVVHCAQVRNNKPGLLFYGFTGAQQLPLHGGSLCVSPPIRRALPLIAGGNPAPANDCSGVFALDWNAFAHGLLGGNPAPGATVLGAEIHAQWWARDQGFAPPNNHSLSNGLRFTVGP